MTKLPLGNGWRGAACAALLVFPVLAAAAEPGLRPRPRLAMPASDPRAAAALFAMPAIAEETRAALADIEAGDLERAARILDRLVSRHPELAQPRANRAALAMLAGDLPGALAHLAAAAGHGLTDLPAIAADPIFALLAQDPVLGPQLADLTALPPPDPAPTPALASINGNRALVSAANSSWNPALERLEPRFAWPAEPAAPATPAKRRSTAQDLLHEHARHGRAAGNHRDLYDNRDRGHSALDPARHPQVTHVAYSAAARAAGVDYGLAEQFLFDRPTFGNSSTAITGGPYWRSLPRHALTRPDGTGPMRLWQNARANHLYVYPAHKDFTEADGDLFPANTPYILVSQGSSGSDQAILEAVAMIFAAFRPETKERLIAERLLVPTVQMIFRRSQQNVRTRESYFSGDAHPAAFEGYQINLARMVSLANAIAPDALPAEARIAVLEEFPGIEGIDYFGAGLSETLFDTPAAIARIWRSKTWRRHMIVSAEDSRDANGRPLEYHWRLLQGDPERVEIEPLGDGSRARITLDWHEPFQISEDRPVTTSRVDIGLFVHNGAHDSAPAILSWYFPRHETRGYEPAPDGGLRIAFIDYADPDKTSLHADPLLFPRANWRDSFAYDAEGRPAGWSRTIGRRDQDYTSQGRRIIESRTETRPARSEAVIYDLRRAKDGALAITEISAGPALRSSAAAGK